MKALEVDIYQKENFNFLKLKGTFKTLEAIQFKDKLLSAIEKSSNLDFSIDLTAVEDMDITALNSLIIGQRNANKKGLKFSVKAQKNHVVFELLDITNFKNFLEFTQ